MENENRPKIIATHDGIFHCDEILACFMLQQLPAYANATIIRTRKPEQIDAADIVVDVGAVYNEATLRFDHHQKTFTHTMASLRPTEFAGAGADKWNIRLSSAGLIYAHFGEQVIRAILKKTADDDDTNMLRSVYAQVYANFIQEIDAIDNGVPMFDGGEPRYRICSDLSSRVANFNAPWNSTGGDDATAADVKFEEAKQLVGAEFIDKVQYYACNWWPARAIVDRAVSNRFDISDSGEILELDESCPWKNHLFDIEVERQCVGVAKFVIFKGMVADDWRVIAVPKEVKSFLCRQYLAKEWRGIGKDELRQVSGIETANFVHANGFIGGCTTRAGAVQMALRSLMMNN